MNCTVTNTYKMAWARALVDLADEVGFSLQPDQKVTITLERIAERFLNYYWNHTAFFNLKQGPLTPIIVSYVKDLVERYNSIQNSQVPKRYEKVNFQKELRSDFESCVKKIVARLKVDVSYRFLKLMGKDFSWMYDYKKSSDTLEIKAKYLRVLKENRNLLYPIINARWAQIIEGFDYSPRINKKVRFLDDVKFQRTALSHFKKWLDLENPSHICFLCETAITKSDLSIDHVIPWSYLFEDNLWNLVYVHRSCNSAKSNRIPDEASINKLRDRNLRFLDIFDKQGFFSGKQRKGMKVAEDLKFAIDNNLVFKFWIGCKG
ncbi:MAG: HNH endonuclease domain-containing protein [Candidatus Helarchaeota archaeon]